MGDGVPVTENAGICNRLGVIKLSDSDLSYGRCIRKGLKWLIWVRFKLGCILTMISAASVSCDDFVVAKL